MARNKARKPSEWRAILEGLKNSGLTQKQYAAQIGCHSSNFGWWRKRLQELDGQPVQNAMPAFVELRAPEVKAAAVLETSGEVRLQSKHGTLITFSSLPPAEYIAQLLREA